MNKKGGFETIKVNGRYRVNSERWQGERPSQVSVLPSCRNKPANPILMMGG